MDSTDNYEILESVAVEMDPFVDGFAGVLVEFIFDGERYVLAETALSSGNCLLRFCSNNWRLPYALFNARLPRPRSPDRAAYADPTN